MVERTTTRDRRAARIDRRKLLSSASAETGPSTVITSPDTSGWSGSGICPENDWSSRITDPAVPPC